MTAAASGTWLNSFLVGLNNKAVDVCEPPEPICDQKQANLLLRWLKSLPHISALSLNERVSNSLSWLNEHEIVAAWCPSLVCLRLHGVCTVPALNMCTALIRARRIRRLELRECKTADEQTLRSLGDAIAESRTLVHLELSLSSSLHALLSGVARCRSLRTLQLDTGAPHHLMLPVDWCRLMPVSVNVCITELRWKHTGALLYNPFAEKPTPFKPPLLPNLCHLRLSFDAAKAEEGEVSRILAGACARMSTLNVLDMTNVLNFSVDPSLSPLALLYTPSSGKHMRVICPPQSLKRPTGSATVSVESTYTPPPPPPPSAASSSLPKSTSPPTQPAAPPRNMFAFPTVCTPQHAEYMWSLYVTQPEDEDDGGGGAAGGSSINFSPPALLPTGQPVHLISLERWKAMSDAVRDEIRALLQCAKTDILNPASLCLRPESPVLMTAPAIGSTLHTQLSRYYAVYPLTMHSREMHDQQVKSDPGKFIADGQGNAGVVQIRGGSIRLFQKKMVLAETPPKALISNWHSYLNEYRTSRCLAKCRYFPAADKFTSFVSDGVGYLSAQLIDSKQCVSLHSLLRARLPTGVLAYFFADLAYAIHAMHSHDIEHNDMHSRNIMCHYLRGTCVVVDFGMSTRRTWLKSVVAEFALPAEFGATLNMNHAHVATDGCMCDVHRALLEIMCPSMAVHHDIAKVVSHLLVCITGNPFLFGPYLAACDQLKLMSDMARAKHPGCMRGADEEYYNMSERMLRPRWALLAAHSEWRSMIEYQPPAVFRTEQSDEKGAPRYHSKLASKSVEYVSGHRDAWLVPTERLSEGTIVMEYHKSVPCNKNGYKVDAAVARRMSDGPSSVPTHCDYNELPLPIHPDSQLKLPSSSSFATRPQLASSRQYKTYSFLRASSTGLSWRAFDSREEMRAAVYEGVSEEESAARMKQVRTLYEMYHAKTRAVPNYYKEEIEKKRDVRESIVACVPFMYRLTPTGHFPFLPSRYGDSYFTPFGAYLAETHFAVATRGLPGFEQLTYAEMKSNGVAQVHTTVPAGSISLYQYLSQCIKSSHGPSRGFQRFLAAQLALLLHILHRRQIIHTNLVLRNILYHDETKELTICRGGDSYTRAQEDLTVRVFGREWSTEMQSMCGVLADYFTPITEMLEFGFSEFATELLRYLPCADKTGVSEQVRSISNGGSAAAFDDCRRVARRTATLVSCWREHMARMSFIHQLKVRYSLCSGVTKLASVSNQPLNLASSSSPSSSSTADLKADS